jgi:hypothetical protein
VVLEQVVHQGAHPRQPRPTGQRPGALGGEPG